MLKRNSSFFFFFLCRVVKIWDMRYVHSNCRSRPPNAYREFSPVVGAAGRPYGEGILRVESAPNNQWCRIHGELSVCIIFRFHTPYH